MIFKNKVETFCCTCIKEKLDVSRRRGHLVGYPINDISYLCTIFFKSCGHKRVSILNLEQIEKMEVKNGTSNRLPVSQV